MEASSKLLGPYIGPSPCGGDSPRPTNGVEVGLTFNPFSGSHRYRDVCVVFEVLDVFDVTVLSSRLLVGSTVILNTRYEWSEQSENCINKC